MAIASELDAGLVTELLRGVSEFDGMSGCGIVLTDFASTPLIASS